MPEIENDLYYVAVKVFLRDGQKLLILHDSWGEWDLPGGRIGKDEFEAPLEDIIERELREELGAHLKYRLVGPKVLMRHERKEITEKNWPKIRIFAVGYEALYQEGEIALSEEHRALNWVNIRNFHPEKYFTGGWLEGVQEYLEQVNHG